MFTIEGNIEVPERVRRGKTEKYPFSQLEVKQSFFVPAGDLQDVVKTVTHAAYGAEKRFEKQGTSKRFTVRKFEQDGVSGARVWRIE
jgi:hypothetical protein